MKKIFILFFMCSIGFAQEKGKQGISPTPVPEPSPRAERFMDFKNPATSLWYKPESTDSKFQFHLQLGKAAFGIGAGYFNCPCVRWSVRVEGPSGVIKTKDVLINIDSIFRFKQEMDMVGSLPQVRLFQTGAAEALFLGGKIGVQFDGLTFGYDYDRNINSVFRTGVAAVTRFFQTDVLALQLKSGYRFQNIQINEAPFQQEHSFPQSFTFGWETGIFRGYVATTFDVRPKTQQRFIAETDLQLRVFDIKDIFSGAAGLNVLFEHDPLREDYNANADLAQAKLYFEVQFDDPVLIEKSQKKSLSHKSKSK